MTVTYWISFEDQTTEQWLGNVIIDAGDIQLDEETAEAFIVRLAKLELTPDIGQRWNVKIQKLPPHVEIPAEYKRRLITDAAITAPLGGMMVSRHGAN
jgi:hypothetical protein